MPEDTMPVPAATPVVAVKSGFNKLWLLVAGLLVLILLMLGVIGYLLVTQFSKPSDGNMTPPPPMGSVPTPAPAPEPVTTPVTVYFYTGPFTQADSTPGTLTFVGATRNVDASGNLYSQALSELVTGPTASETAAGERVAFNFTGTSTCGTSDFTVTKTGSTLKVALCKDLDFSAQDPGAGGAYAGISLTMASNAREEIKKTLKFGGVTTVEVRDKNGQCVAPDVEDTDCTP